MAETTRRTLFGLVAGGVAIGAVPMTGSAAIAPFRPSAASDDDLHDALAKADLVFAQLVEAGQRLGYDTDALAKISEAHARYAAAAR